MFIALLDTALRLEVTLPTRGAPRTDRVLPSLAFCLVCMLAVFNN